MAWKPFITNLLGLDGAPEAGGLLQSFVKDTTTPRPLFSDAGTTPLTNPVVADVLGQITAMFNDTLQYSWQARTADRATVLWEVSVVGGVLSLTYVNPEYSVHPIIESTWVPALGSPLGAGWKAAFGQDIDEILDDARAIRNCTDYAELTGLSADGLATGGVFLTRCRATDDDGGSGLWRYDAASTATANGGTILAIDGGGPGRFFRLFEDKVSPAWFGAKGDGATNDATALQSTISFAAANGYTIEDEGAYAVSAGLTCASGKLVMSKLTLKALAGLSGGDLLTVSGTAAKPMFRGVTFDGNDQAYTLVKVDGVDEPSYDRCRFLNTGNAASAVQNVRALWLKNTKRPKVSGCAFEGAHGQDVVRFIFMAGATDVIIRGNSFHDLTSAGDDGDAIVSEDYNTDVGAIVAHNTFSDIQKRLVKTGGNGWVIQGNRAKIATGGLYSLFSLYGNNMRLDNNIVDASGAAAGAISYAIDVGASPTVSSVRNITITNNQVKLPAYVSSAQDFIQFSSDAYDVVVQGNQVDECRYFASAPNSGLTLKNLKFIGNSSTACADHEFAFNNATITDLTVAYHHSETSVASRTLVSATGTVIEARLIGNSYNKSFGLTNIARLTEAAGNMNAGVRETLFDFRNEVKWIYRSTPPTTGAYLVGDLTWGTTPALGGSAGWVCATAGTPGTWYPFGQISAPPRSAANIADATNAINTSDKFAGRLVWDSTNKRELRASGAAATDAWDVVDGSASVTPV